MPTEFEQLPAHEFLRTHDIRGRRSSALVKQLILEMRANGWSGAAISTLVSASGIYILDGHHRVFSARLARILVPHSPISIDRLPLFGYSSLDEVIIAHAEAGPNRIRLD